MNSGNTRWANAPLATFHRRSQLEGRFLSYTPGIFGHAFLTDRARPRLYTMGVDEIVRQLLAVAAVFFIGLSKAGFGGGLGMLTTPLCAMAFDAKVAIGIILPLLSAGDIFSLYHYWGKWDRRNLTFLLPGVVVGVLVGVQLVGMFNTRQMNFCIGLLAVLFVVFQFSKEVIFRAEGAFAPNHLLGVPCGVGTGITSSMAHGAGPIVSMFLIPQRLHKEIYVGTNVLIFTWVNWIKMPFFFAKGIINRHTLELSLWYLPLIPVGVWLGVWLNRKFSEGAFIKVVYVFTLLAGLELMLHTHLTHWLRGHF